MKITKNELRKIIKEEKSKLLNEMMSPRNADTGSTAERNLGLYANTALVDNLKQAIRQLLEQIETDAYEDMGDELDSEEAAEGVVLMIIAQAFGIAGAGYERAARELGKLVR